MNNETATTMVQPPDTHVEDQPTIVMNPAAPNPDDQPTLVTEPENTIPDDQPTLVAENVGQLTPDETSYDDESLGHDLRLKVIDASQGVVAKASDNADRYIAEKTTERGVKGIIKRIWYGNLGRDYVRLRETQKGRNEIVETGNINVLQDVSQGESDMEMAAVVTRFTDEYLHSGERQDNISDVEQAASLEGELRVIVNFYAQGLIDADVLTEKKTRILNDYKKRLHAEDRNKGLLLADNVLDVAQAARSAVEHGVGMERIQAALTAQVGEATIGQRTETRRELTDKIVDTLYNHKVGSVLNEGTIALVTGVALAAAKITVRKATTAAAATLSMGLGAGVIAGVREHAHIGRERQQHLRERAVGQEMPGGSAKRRERMEETRYETASASDLIDRLTRARENFSIDDPASVHGAMQDIGEVEARIRMSDEGKVDLIDYTSSTTIEQERLQLDMALREMKTTANLALANASDETIELLNIDRNVDDIINANTEFIRDLTEDINEKDAAFARLRRNQTAKMAGIGLVTGLGVGVLVQEARGLLSESLQGVFDKGNGSVDRQTLMAGLLGHNAGSHLIDSHGGHTGEHAINIHEAVLDKNAALDLPPDYHLEQTSPGHWNLIGTDGRPSVDGLSVDAHGSLSEASREALAKSGFHMSEHTQSYVTHHLEHHDVTRTPDDFLRKHPGDFTKVNRQLWYDENTPGDYRLNELKLDWGGSNGSGIDVHGDYVFNVSQMTADGSFHDGLSANAQQLIHEGKMSIALSMTEGTQSHVVMVPIDIHGNAIIKANSWVAKSMFESHDGHAEFIGAYAEAAQLMGNHDGVETTRMLATVVGSNNPNHVTDVVSHLVSENHERVITQLVPLEHAPTHVPVEIPGVFPIYGRRGLEYGGNEVDFIPYMGGSYVIEGYRDSEQLMPRRGLAPFAPELEVDPNAKVNANEATERYLRSLRPTYRRTVDRLTESLGKEPKANKPKVVVMIPAAAHQEGDNIRRTLDQYAAQDGIDADNFEVVVFANYPRGARRDKTISEVRQFQKDNPNIKVRLVQKQLEEGEANIGWIRKAVTDSVIVDLRSRGVNLDEVILVSNDADSEWINPGYLRTIIEKAEAAPETDAFLGFLDWSYDAYKAHPEILAATRFMQMIDTYMRVSKHQIGSSGANFAFRPGIYTAVGGYNPGAPIAEDVMLGRMIKSVRAGADTRRPISFLGRSSEVNTSARRALEKLFKDGGAPAAQWQEAFGPNDELRNKEFDLVDFDLSDEAAVERMVESTERMLNQTLKIYSSSLVSDDNLPSYREGRLTMFDNETIRQLNRMCFFVGVKVKWLPDGTLSIIDASKMISGMKLWSDKH